MSLKQKWKQIPSIYKVGLSIIIILSITYVIKCFPEMNIKIPLTKEREGKKFPVYISTTDLFEEAICQPGSFGIEPIITVKDTEMPAKFRDYKIEVYCIMARKEIDDINQRAYWNLKNIGFKVERPTEIIQYYSQVKVLKEIEYFVISQGRGLWIKGLNGEFWMNFVGFEPSSTIGIKEGYQTNYPQPSFLILKLKWFEPPDIVGFLKEQFKEIGSTILSYILK